MTPPTVQFIPGAVAPSLVIHDAFGGTGNVGGRTPDTVDNGNLWVCGSAGDYVVTSGAMYAGVSSLTSFAVIDCGSTTCQIIAETRGSRNPLGTVGYRHGIIVSYDPGSGAWSRIHMNDNQTLVLGEYTGSIYTSTVIDTFTPQPITGDFTWTIDVSGTTIDWDIANSGGSITSGSTTATYATSYCGGWIRYNNSNSYIADFKVYA